MVELLFRGEVMGQFGEVAGLGNTVGTDGSQNQRSLGCFRVDDTVQSGRFRLVGNHDGVSLLAHAVDAQTDHTVGERHGNVAAAGIRTHGRCGHLPAGNTPDSTVIAEAEAV